MGLEATLDAFLRIADRFHGTNIDRRRFDKPFAKLRLDDRVLMHDDGLAAT